MKLRIIMKMILETIKSKLEVLIFMIFIIILKKVFIHIESEKITGMELGGSKLLQSEWARPKITPLVVKSGWANVSFHQRSRKKVGGYLPTLPTKLRRPCAQSARRKVRKTSQKTSLE